MCVSLFGRHVRDICNVMSVRWVEIVQSWNSPKYCRCCFQSIFLLVCGARCGWCFFRYLHDWEILFIKNVADAHVTCTHTHRLRRKGYSRSVPHMRRRLFFRPRTHKLFHIFISVLCCSLSFFDSFCFSIIVITLPIVLRWLWVRQ